MNAPPIAQIRAFNRFYTATLGLLSHQVYDSPFTLPQVRVLFELHQQPGLLATDLAARLHIDKGYLSRLLQQLGKAGLVAKTVTPTDKRAATLHLTPAGQQAFAGLDQRSNEHVAALVAHLAPPQLAQLLQSLATVEQLLPLGSAAPTLDQITIRTELRPGDLGFVVHRHAQLYAEEYGFTVQFEGYVAQAISEFCLAYHPQNDRVWICEHRGQIIGFLALMHREPRTSQLRFFYLEPPYRGLGLGKKLMELFMEFHRAGGYTSSFLYTISELGPALSLYTRHGYRLAHEADSGAFGRPVREQRYEWHPQKVV
ncbi:MAG: bifunctional helix-turn-helix transcriptional regulator/GNAT family N-acetyltransferase [Bernardetiaceae bacterium]|jgi:DNA-binding MarR family transcriptional regulator/GNAT superfamily N-acetyltransferase|nr:bifunctional helix-turn-helix transcriptional regulator/GNAT family N-acetyltransferase [Bernardetiaceae bacterium]